uniref:C2H2-type domain-containing protein n=1 Tax=Macrostomum lignano TaxID=282301 RepID=A0A1I8F316_9PLAT
PSCNYCFVILRRQTCLRPRTKTSEPNFEPLVWTGGPGTLSSSDESLDEELAPSPEFFTCPGALFRCFFFSDLASFGAAFGSSTVSSFSPPNASVAMTTSANATAVELAWKHYERQHREQQQQMLMMYSYWNALQPTGACEATPYPYIPGTSQQQPQPQQLQIQFVNTTAMARSAAQRTVRMSNLSEALQPSAPAQPALKCHSTLKRFLCSYCGKGFNDTFDLKRHTRTHTGVRPYKCTDCGKAFTQRCSLESHARKLHGRALGFGHKERREKLHVCELCGHSTACARQHLSHAKQHQQAERPAASSAGTEEATLWQLFQAAASGLNLHT